MASLNYATLTPTERAHYYAALGDPGQATTLRVHVHDLNHTFLRDISPTITADGSTVTYDRNNDVEITATINAVDLTGAIADLDLRHLISVEHGQKVPGLDYDTVYTPVIMGRVMVPVDKGDAASIELHGKESFGLLPGSPTRVWREGRRAAEAIRAMFKDLGETHFRISESLIASGPKLGKDWHTGGGDEEKAPMRVARRIGKSHGLQVFFDATGYLVVRYPPSTPSATWSETDSIERQSVTPLTGRIEWTRDLREVRNVVRGKGKKGIVESVSADPSHIYSPQSLARGPVGAKVPGNLVHYFEDTSIKTRAALRARCSTILQEVLTETTQAKFDAVPVYHVGPNDLIEARRRDGLWGQWYLQEAQIPLSTDQSMTVGYLPNIKGRRR